MIDIDRQIELAKRKPLTAENLNYIGDLYLKKNDKQRAVAYFFEASDKLHFAQKDKKIAIYKKILKISPVSEKAYIGISEILSKMGLVMEEKKFLHMLAQLYESRGESDKASALIAKIRELDPHVIPDGTFFHREAHKEVMEVGEVGEGRGKQSLPIEINEKDLSPLNEKSMTDAQAPVPASDREEGKLIEATLEEILPEESSSATATSKRHFWPRYIFGGGVVLLLGAIVAAVLFNFLPGTPGKSVALLPVSTRVNDYEITVSRLDNPAELTGVISEPDLSRTDFYVLAVNSRENCVPDAFAAFPYNMISLLDMKGGATPVKPLEGLQKTTKTITKMNVCGRDHAVVFVRMIVAVDRQKHYSGLALNGLQNTGPLRITWESR
ncbi:MAG: hypothetical protein HZA15_01220 [Nitrospirae bacterium]|nr:hypothetical protein [Nitrospirota bacterium]